MALPRARVFEGVDFILYRSGIRRVRHKFQIALQLESGSSVIESFGEKKSSVVMSFGPPGCDIERALKKVERVVEAFLLDGGFRLDLEFYRFLGQLRLHFRPEVARRGKFERGFLFRLDQGRIRHYGPCLHKILSQFECFDAVIRDCAVILIADRDAGVFVFIVDVGLQGGGEGRVVGEAVSIFAPWELGTGSDHFIV